MADNITPEEAAAEPGFLARARDKVMEKSRAAKEHVKKHPWAYGAGAAATLGGGGYLMYRRRKRRKQEKQASLLDITETLLG